MNSRVASLAEKWMIRDKTNNHSLRQRMNKEIERYFPDYWKAMVFTQHLCTIDPQATKILQQYKAAESSEWLFDRAYRTMNVMFVYRKHNLTTFSLDCIDEADVDTDEILLIRVPPDTPVLALSMLSFVHRQDDKCEMILPGECQQYVLHPTKNRTEFEQQAVAFGFVITQECVYMDLLMIRKPVTVVTHRPFTEDSMHQEIQHMQSLGTNVPFGPDPTRQLTSEDIDRGLQYLADTIPFQSLTSKGDNPQRRMTGVSSHDQNDFVHVQPCVSIGTLIMLWHDDPFYLKLLTGKSNTRILIMGVTEKESSRHWLLLAIDIEHFHLYIFNSLRDTNADRVLSSIEDFLADKIESPNLLGNHRQYTTQQCDIPLLRDSINCGVFVLEFARLFLQNKMVFEPKKNGVHVLNMYAIKTIDILAKRQEWSIILYGTGFRPRATEQQLIGHAKFPLK
jgi:hypothetical protein